MCPTISELEAQLNEDLSSKDRIDILNELARLLNSNDAHRSRSLAEQAYQLASNEEKPYLLGMAASLATLAGLNNDAGDYDLSLSQSLHVHEILESISADEPEAGRAKVDTFANLSWAYRSIGDYEIAIEYAMTGLKLAETIENRKQETRILNILSVIYAESNNLNAALEMGQKVVERYRELGERRGECIALNNLALTYLDMGDGEQALKIGQTSLQLSRDIGANMYALTALNSLGEIYLGIADHAKAEEFLLQALQLAREYKSSSEELQSLLTLGKLYKFQQNNQAALTTFYSALTISQGTNDRRNEFLCYQELSEIHEKQGRFEAALQHYRKFHELKETVFNEKTAKRLAGLQVIHQVETAKRDAEINFLKTIELKREIEERKLAQENLQKLASIDPLTGILNRREFFNLGEHEVNRAKENGYPLTAIILDLDHFKQINDIHGHAVGDQVLINTTKTMRDNLRQGEIIGRYGGDEFVVLMPGSNRSQGRQIAERLREKLSTQTIGTPKNGFSVTVSLGIAELQQASDKSLEMLLAYADQALYEAKRSGRNRIAVYTDSN